MTTIFAPITASNGGAVGVIRVSGPDCLNCFSTLGIKTEPKHSSCFVSNLIDPKTSEIIDQALISFFKAPRSFTGEDVLEISIHNSPFVLGKLSEILLQNCKFRFAQPGEFSKRAVLNGKIDLVQAEAIPDLISSETAAAHRQAVNQLRGNLSQIYENWRSRIIELSAMIAAAIDFPDEDLPVEIWQQVQQRVRNLADEIAMHLDDKRLGSKIRDGFSAVILGAPNVGKSSLLNFLANREVAIVSKHPGTTRDIIELHLHIAGVEVVIADTAGIRDIADEIEQEGIKRALQRAKTADLKIFMVDATSSINDFKDLPIDSNSIILINKTDILERKNLQFESEETLVEAVFSGACLQNSQTENLSLKTFSSNNSEALTKISELKITPILISVLREKNLDKVILAIESKLKDFLPNNNQNFITQERYRAYLQNCEADLREFNTQKNIELAAEDLRSAAVQLGKITGKVDFEKILDVVFSKFCIGK